MKIKSKEYFISEQQPIVLMRMESQSPVELHQHEFHELVIVTKGQGIHFTETDQYPVRAGDVFLIKTPYSHGYRETENLYIANLLFIPDKIDLPIGELCELPGYHAFFELEPRMRQQHGFKSRLRLNLEQLKVVEDFLKKIDQQQQKHKPGKRFMVFSYFVQLLFYLSECYQQTDSKHSSVLLQIGEVISYIENHYTQEITLEKLMRLAGMSKRSLIRHFNETMHQTPIEFLLKTRVAHAATLLQQGLAVSDVAMQTGFNDSNYFSRQFKKVTGLSPRHYKQGG